MATQSGDSVLSPPLDKCLSGEHQLLSWKDAFQTLCDFDPATENEPLRQFLTDDSSVAVLSRPLKPFGASTPQSKSSFETKTAAINVTPSDNGQYDITQIKEDSLWLSKETKIDEVAALRVVVLEWQTRPAAQLLSGFTEEETLSVQDAAGGANLGSSTFLPNASILAATAQGIEQTFATFASTDQRRLRLLKIHLSERAHILKINDLLIRLAAKNSNKTSGTGASWLDEASKKLWETQRTAETTGGYVAAIRNRLDGLAEGSGWNVAEEISEEVEESWSLTQLTEAVQILQIFFTIVDADSEVPKSDAVLAWFEFANSYRFFNQFIPQFPSQSGIATLFQALVSVISLAMLRLSPTLTFIEEQLTEGRTVSASERNLYICDPDCVGRITEILIDAAGMAQSPATPAVFAWSIMVQTIKNAVEVVVADREQQNPDSEDHSALEEILESISDVPVDEDVAQYLGKASVVGGEVIDLIANLSLSLAATYSEEVSPRYGMKGVNVRTDAYLGARLRLQFLWLIRDGLFMITYGPTVLSATMSVLSGGQQYWDLADRSPGDLDDPVIDAYRNDEVLLQEIYRQAVLRYPYETVPMLKHSSVLLFAVQADQEGSLLVAHALQHTLHFTQRLPENFNKYESVREEMEQDWIKLQENLPLFSRKSRRSHMQPTTGDELVPFGSWPSDEDMFIPMETEGTVVNSTQRPPIVTWRFEHSALRYLATGLSCVLSGSGLVENGPRFEHRLDVASEFIELLAMLLTASTKAPGKADDEVERNLAAQAILESASDGLGQSQDIVSLIFDIFEENLQKLRDEPGQNIRWELVVNCVHFMHALLVIMPNRVWPFFTRSRLLDLEGAGGSLAAVVQSTEMVIGHYDFLIGCTHLFKALVEDAIRHSVSRKSPTKSVTRFASAVGGGSPEKVMNKVLVSFAKTMVGVFESCPSWRFTFPEQRLNINLLITSTWSDILQHVYGFDDVDPAPQKLTSVLQPTAEYILGVFLAESANDIPTHALINIIYAGTKIAAPGLIGKTPGRWVAQTLSALSFSTLLLQTGVLLGRPISHLEKQLFKAAPLLARLSIAHSSFKVPVVQLLETLVTSAARGDNEPPSLLGHLGPETAKSFLSVISTLGGPFNDTEVEISIWRLLSAVVSNKQQWFAIYILTGKTPRDTLKKGSTSSTRPRGKPLLQTALDQLCTIESLPPWKAAAMLEFISLSQNNWPWAMTDMHKHRTFLHSIMDFINKLNPPSQSASPESLATDCIKIHMASLVADIGAMCLHYSRQIGDVKPAQHVISRLEYLVKCGVQVPQYNFSLQTSLKKNLEERFPGIKLTNFKKTRLQRTEFGENYFYDIPYAAKVLGFHQSWRGVRNQGFAEEFRRANVNLSLVEAQIMLMKSWKLLALELGNIVKKDHRLESILARVVEDCLKANQDLNVPQGLFDRLIHIRAEFAFVLLQRLVSANCNNEQMRSLIGVAWNTIRSSNQNFETAFADENADYYRSLVRILFLTLQPHLSGPDPSKKVDGMPKGLKQSVPSIAPLLQEILFQVVAGGLRSLAAQVHEDRQRCSPADFVLISALLQTILRIPGMQALHGQISLLFANNNTSRFALSLFTWSDQLMVDGDPIYGEVSILFLLELSHIFPLAETLAVEGILSQLSTAKVLRYYQHPLGMGPFDNPPRLHSIWTRGILPLCLNLLDAVGPPVASEIATFLNQFPNQLARASSGAGSRATSNKANPNADAMTLSIASEVQSLSLISIILERFRVAGAATAAGVDIPPLAWDRAVAKEEVENWLSSRRTLRDRIMPVTEKEVEFVKMRAVDPGSGAENRLEERVVRELEGALACLNADIGGG
ncbi:hypothetical protein K490DRAFT_42356 [Saccharata proteae CBS 121410]|uniref:Nucleoporin NUP188 n=1 Tax=Saccharata proteae CBS 121410 TaxID=1314787 RepID=A0A9P4LWS1_9PEZI|nr:hypothetical protein K490DRAFT_42356 [Saccharata proteae CBS 121410]